MANGYQPIIKWLSGSKISLVVFMGYKKLAWFF